MSAIGAKITDKVLEWKMRSPTPDMPSKLYLGRMEDAMIASEFSAIRHVKTEFRSERRRYMDMEIFVVDAGSHLGVGT